MQQSCRTKNFPINFNFNEIFIRYNDISSIFHSLAVIDKRSEMGSADCSLENEVTNWRLWLSGVETIVDKIVVLLFARYSIQDRCLWPEEQKKEREKKIRSSRVQMISVNLMHIEIALKNHHFFPLMSLTRVSRTKTSFRAVCICHAMKAKPNCQR